MFSSEFCEILKPHFYRTLPGDCFCSTEKYFTNKTAKSSSKNEKIIRKQQVWKQRHMQKKTWILLRQSSYRFTIQTYIYSRISASHHILKARVSRNNASNMKFGLGWNLKKIYCNIRNHPWIFLDAKSRVKIKIFKSSAKNVLFGCFVQQFWKHYGLIWFHCPRLCIAAKFGPKKKRSFSLGPKMSYLGILGLELKFILSYLKSLPSNLSYCQFV